MITRFQVVPAAYVILRRTGVGGEEVLLQLRRGTGYMDEHWATAAAGHVEAGESVVDAARREVAEELGVRIEPGDLVPLCGMHRTDGNGRAVDERVDFFFECRTWAPEPRLMEPEKSAGSPWTRSRDRSFRTSCSCWSICARTRSRRSSRSGSEAPRPRSSRSPSTPSPSARRCTRVSRSTALTSSRPPAGTGDDAGAGAAEWWRQGLHAR
ncbi:MAG: NUDIX domain-containing protein [Actinomycetales bacterium]|nr:NUDIX domain-containing protein [Actinomycetales bacterium]